MKIVKAALIVTSLCFSSALFAATCEPHSQELNGYNHPWVYFISIDTQCNIKISLTGVQCNVGTLVDDAKIKNVRIYKFAYGTCPYAYVK